MTTTERVIMVRESTFREMRDALERSKGVIDDALDLMPEGSTQEAEAQIVLEAVVNAAWSASLLFRKELREGKYD